MAENILTMENIVKTYKMGDEQQTVLNGIDLQVDKGEFVAILGPSGSGKSTLMNIIGCLDTATSGTYHLHGRDVSALSESELARVRSKEIGFIFQSFQLLQRQDALQNVELPLIYAGMSGHERAARAQQMLERVGLKDKMHHFPNQLSGGQQQRVAIARALVNEPEVLLLDEPLGALDLKLRKEMQIELKRMQKKLGITFIFVTHDQEEALTMSDTIAVMNHGIIQQIGCPTDVYNEPKNRFVARFIGESNIFEATMRRDYLVNIHGIDYECVDAGFGTEQPVDVVIRPEDVDFVPIGKTPLHGVVTSVLFMGVHYEFTVDCDGRIFKVHSTDFVPVGETVGIEVLPDAIHIMNPERRQPTEAAAEEPQQNL